MKSGEQKFEMNAHYAQVLDSISDMVLVKGPKSKLLWANRAFLKYYGMTNEELQGLIDAPFSEPDYTQKFVKDDAYVFSTAQVLDIPAEPVTRHDGQTRYFHTVKTPILDKDGKVIMTVGVSRDITEKLAADKLLRESEARFKQIFASNLVGITVSTDKGELIDANDSYLNLVGYTREDCKNGLLRRETIIADKHSPLEEAEARLQLRTAGFVIPFEKNFRRKDGSIVPVLMGISRLGESEDQLICFILDLSERKRQERLIDEQRQKMITTSKFSALGEMSGAIAHEINNPLTIIHGKAGQLKEMAEEGTLTVDAVSDAAGKIEKTALRISKIVKALRSFSRDGEKDPFDIVLISELMDDTIEFCRERFRKHSIDLVIEDFDPSLTVECQPIQLSQVLLNLLINANDAVANLPEKWVRIGVSENKDAMVFRVTDSGSGIPDALRDKIMQPFFTTKEVGRGTGIGLSVSKGIVESHQGELRLDESSPNTSFVVELPLRQPATARSN